MNLRELFEGLNNSLPNENNLGNSIADSDSKLKNFWNWFNGSKIVDDNGRPIEYIMAHHLADLMHSILKRPVTIR